MKAFFIIISILLSVFFLGMLFFAIKTHKFTKTILFNSFMGLIVLTIIDITRSFTGIYIPINLYTVSASGLFGVPGLCGLLILQIIFL